MGTANFNGQQFRTAQHALPGMSNPAMASQRVTPPTPAPAPAAPAASPSTWTQPELSMLGPTPSSPASPSAAGPTPTHWPAPAAAPAPAASAPAKPPVVINRTAYAAAGQRFGPPPNQPSPAAASPASPTPAPARPATPPATAPAARPQAPAWVGRAGRMGGLAIGLGAKTFESVNRVATDPARSGNPLYKPTGGWNKS